MFKRRPFHLSAGWLTLVELIVLAPAAGILVFGVVPSAFDVEWGCLGGFGVTPTDGDTYLAGAAELSHPRRFAGLIAMTSRDGGRDQ